MSEDKSFDHFKILTKQQIIDYLKAEYFFHAPDKSKIKFFLYNAMMKEYLIKTNENLNDKSSSIAAKKADEIAVKINAETDIDKKLSLLKEREKHVDVVRKNMKIRENLDAEYKKIQKLIE